MTLVNQLLEVVCCYVTPEYLSVCLTCVCHSGICHLPLMSLDNVKDVKEEQRVCFWFIILFNSSQQSVNNAVKVSKDYVTSQLSDVSLSNTFTRVSFYFNLVRLSCHIRCSWVGHHPPQPQPSQTSHDIFSFTKTASILGPRQNSTLF